MERHKLTDEERQFRKIGAGIPFSRWWPAALVVIGLLIAGLNPQFIANCTDMRVDEQSPRQSARFALFLAYPCSPFLLREGSIGWLNFAVLWAPLPFGIINWRWTRRHRRFWNGERLKEKEQRNAKRQADVSENE